MNMTDSDFVKNGKTLFAKIIAQRRWLITNKKGHISASDALTQINNLEYANAKINDAKQLKSYIQRKQTTLKYLINSNYKQQHELLNALIDAQIH